MFGRSNQNQVSSIFGTVLNISCSQPPNQKITIKNRKKYTNIYLYAYFLHVGIAPPRVPCTTQESTPPKVKMHERAHVGVVFFWAQKCDREQIVLYHQAVGLAQDGTHLYEKAHRVAFFFCDSINSSHRQTYGMLLLSERTRRGERA